MPNRSTRSSNTRRPGSSPFDLQSSSAHRATQGLLLLLLVTGLAGCGGKESTVSGIVTLDGQPLEHGNVAFSPTAGGMRATAIIQSAVMMLRHIGEDKAADRIHGALFRQYAEQKVLTGDIGGNATTKKFTAELCRLVRG